jgi:23S rRNA (cytidine2498-2'-O)-methyltransferase
VIGPQAKMANSTFFFSHPDYEADFLSECERDGIALSKVLNGLFKTETKHNGSLVWPRDTWADSEIVEFESVSKAVARLREISKLPWRHVSLASHRRGELIEQAFSSKAKLLKARAGKVGWPGDLKRARVLPCFSLTGTNQLIACAEPSEEAPGGIWNFDEDREGPPSRAYLKLWEWSNCFAETRRNCAGPWSLARRLDLGPGEIWAHHPRL